MSTPTRLSARLARLLNLVPYFTANPGISAAEAARELDVEARGTVRDDGVRERDEGEERDDERRDDESGDEAVARLPGSFDERGDEGKGIFIYCVVVGEAREYLFRLVTCAVEFVEYLEGDASCPST